VRAHAAEHPQLGELLDRAVTLTDRVHEYYDAQFADAKAGRRAAYVARVPIGSKAFAEFQKNDDKLDALVNAGWTADVVNEGKSAFSQAIVIMSALGGAAVVVVTFLSLGTAADSSAAWAASRRRWASWWLKT
jgi:hypothetical protein